MQEIERKFLVDTSRWNAVEKPIPFVIRQGYLSSEINATVRVRIKNDRGFLTIKGKTVGISRAEYEYEIPLKDAENLLETMCSKVLSKKRFAIPVGNHTWEVDEFEGKLAPLILAEIELKSEDEPFEKPTWATEDVSDQAKYYNSNLVENC